MKGASRVSAVVCARNEADKIDACLRALEWADEVVVFDMASEDDTAARARPRAHRVISVPPAAVVERIRDRMLREAAHDWVLVVDPDERVPEALAGALRRFLDEEAKAGDIGAVRIARKNYILGRAMRATGWYPDRQIRLLDRRRCAWPEVVHAVPRVAGRIFDLPAEEGAELLHYNYASVGEFLEKANRYTSAHAARLKEKGRPFRWYKLIYHPLKEIFLRLFMRGGYRDGFVGLLFSLLMGYYYLVVYAKLWELERAGASRPQAAREAARGEERRA